MNTFIQTFFFAFLAVTAENALFTTGIGFSRALRAARKPKTILLYSAFLTIFTLISAIASVLLNQPIISNQTIAFARPALFAVLTAVLYFVVAFVLKTWLPEFYKRAEPILSPAAINCLVLSMPFLQRIYIWNVWNAIGFAIGTGVAFLLASVTLSEAMKKLQNPNVPKAFRGLPTLFLYIGILSLAFMGITGGKLF